MASHANQTLALVLAQARPVEPPGAFGQALPFLLAGLVILAVVVWAVAGGMRRRREEG